MENSASMIQQLTDYSVDMDQENVMDVRTEKIDPIVSSAYRYTFRFDSAAYLDKNTMLMFKCRTPADVAGTDLRLNGWNGGLGAIKDVELQIGDFQVQKIHNVNDWSTLNHLKSASPEVQNKKFSHYLQNGLKYKVLNKAGTADSDIVGAIAVDNDKSGINYGRADTSAGAQVNNHKILTDAAGNQLIGIPLGMLLPMLNTRDLPLFLFTAYKIHLTIEFNPVSSEFANKIVTAAPVSGLAAADGDILFSDVNLLVDYLVFPSKVQESVRAQTQQQGGYVMDFINVENIQKTLAPPTANTEQQQEFRINVINQEVHYLQMLKKTNSNEAVNNNKVLLGQRCDSTSVEEYQVNINGVDFYNFGFVFNPLEMYNNVTYVLGKDLQVVAPYYVADINTEASMISPPDQGILGKYKPLALDLRNGEPTIRGGGRVIGDYPIRWIYKRVPHGQVESVTNPSFQVGQNEVTGLDINYFVGVTRVVSVLSLPSGGMQVVVSDL